MIAPKSVYTTDRTEPLSDFRMLVGLYPEAIHGDSRELARLLRCPEHEAEEARRWMLEDGLEVRA
jgi:hypothetical protein